MNQFDVLANPEHSRQPNVPYVVKIQSDHFTGAHTSVVIPLVRIAALKVATALNPSFATGGERVTLGPFQMPFMPTPLLRKKVCSLVGERISIVRAVDALLSGL